MKKPLSSVIAIDSRRSTAGSSMPPPLPPTNQRKYSMHSTTRRSFVAMFLVGRSVRRIARFHDVPEADVESEIRANLLPPAEIRRNYSEREAA